MKFFVPRLVHQNSIFTESTEEENPPAEAPMTTLENRRTEEVSLSFFKIRVGCFSYTRLFTFNTIMVQLFGKIFIRIWLLKLTPEREEEDLVSEAEGGDGGAGDTSELQPGQEVAGTTAEQTWGFNRARMPGTVEDQPVQEISGKGSSINEVTQFLIIFDTPFPPSSRFFLNKAQVLLSQNP
jgi:hypothetical protein